jgi:DNA-binding Lrp family transcriptional regulator
MISVFLREQKRYTQEDLGKKFRCSEEKTVHILKRLKEYGVLKAVKANDTQKDLTDLVDEDIEIADVEVAKMSICMCSLL